MGRAIEVLLKWFMLIVFAGWIMVWMVLPTQVYRKEWSPAIKTKTNTTYFGSLGRNIVILGVPIFLVAVLGCIYLHLEQKRTSKAVVQRAKRGNKICAFFNRPAVVNGPMGILTAMELVFFIMFVALVIWHTVVFIYVGFERVTPEYVKEKGYDEWEVKLENAALRIGLVGNFCLAFLFFPVTRASSLLPLIGLTSESSVRYHIWVGHITMVLFTVHGFLYFVYWASIDRFNEVLMWASSGASNVAGELSLLAGLVLWATTYPSIRRKFYEVFFYTHQLYTLFLIFFALHVGMGHFFWILPGIYLFILDRYLRFLQSSSNIRVISARVLPSAYELTFAKSPGCNFSALSTMFLNIPSVSRLQWHSFTISSSSRLEPGSMSVVIKKEGKFTNKLYDVLASDPSPSILRAAVEGPYGPNTNHFLNYDSLLLVSGGSGITPFFGMIRELLHIAATVPKEHRHIPDVHLICAFKNSADFKMLDLMLPLTGSYNNELSQVNLRIDAYITRENEAVAVKKQSQTIRFKDSPSDHPITHALGNNQWLWLGAVITASFLLFLLLLGFATRFYIYENKQGGSGHHVHYSIAASTRHSLILFLMCISTVVVASIAVLWIKKKNAREGHVGMAENSSPETSPEGSYAKKSDIELESFPNESIHKATTMQYGRRPDLKRILLEYDSKKQIGAYVSGPSAMRHEVASICGSGLANNLHFESCSFTW